MNARTVFLMALIALLKNAFFDESGTHDQSDMVAVGGIVASYEALARAEIEWGRVLKRRDARFFHFNKFMAREPPFDWPKTDKGQIERDNFIERLATIVSDATTLGTAYGIFKTDYKELLPSLRREFKDIYYSCCYLNLDGLAKWDRTFKGPRLPKPLEFLFDRKRKFEGYASKICYDVVRQFAGTDLFGEMGFGNKEIDVPLQMADLVVGGAIRHFRRQRQYGLNVEPNRLIARLNTKGRMWLIWMEKEVLLRFNAALRTRPNHKR
jgi:hypothetical protein